LPLEEAGVDSLGAVEFRTQLAQKLGGVELPTMLIFEFPTVRLLQDHVSRLLTAAFSSSAQISKEMAPLSLQEGATFTQIRTRACDIGKPLLRLHEVSSPRCAPLFVAHSVWGNCEHYRGFARSITTDVWGIEHLHLSSGDDAHLAHLQFEDLASSYVAHINNACASRYGERYNLMGGSVGGYLAFRIAVTAALMEVKPLKLILIDPPPPRLMVSLPEFESDVSRVAAELVRLRLQIFSQDVDLPKIYNAMSAYRHDIWGLAVGAVLQSKEIGFAPFNIYEIERARRLILVHMHFMKLMSTPEAQNDHHQQPQSVYVVQLILCAPQERLAFWEHFYQAERLFESYSCVDDNVSFESHLSHLSLIQEVATGRERTIVDRIHHFLCDQGGVGDSK